MRFRTSHKVVGYLVAGLGILSLALGGILHPVVVVATTLVFAASWWAEEPLIAKKAYIRAWTVALVVLLAIQIVRVATGGAFIERSIEFAIVLQLSRLWNRRGARDYQQIVVLSLVHLIASSVLDQDVSFAILYAGFVVALPWAMTLSHLRREIEGNYRRSEPEAQRAHVNRILNSRRIISPRFLWATALLALPIFAMSGALFFIFPRVGLGVLASGPRRRITVAGFSDRVQLGDMGVVRNDSTVVMRVEVEPLAAPPPRRLNVHWRGAAYDHYDGRQWSRTRELTRRDHLAPIGERYHLARRAPRARERTEYRIFLEDLDPPVLLLPPRPAVVVMAPKNRGTWRQANRDLYLYSGLRELRRESTPALVVHYVVEAWSDAPAFFTSDDLSLRRGHDPDLGPFLQLPELDPRVAELARRITADSGGDHTRMADAIAAYLRSELAYSLDLRGTSDERPLEDFLFRRRSGHCEFFSTAMAVMLRTVGVPTRNVTGFLGGALNPYGGDGAYYTVSHSDAHSWVEVYISGVGWVVYDPTPPGPGYAAESSLLGFVYDLLDASQLAWEKNVVAYDIESQSDAMLELWHFSRRWRSSWERRNAEPGSVELPGRDSSSGWYVAVPAALVGFGLLVGWWLLRRRRRRQKRERRRRGPEIVKAESLLLLLDGALARRGLTRPGWRTPKEHTRRLLARDVPGADLVASVVGSYNEVRFGGRRFAEGEEAELRALVRRIGALPAMLPPPEPVATAEQPDANGSKKGG